MRTIALMLMLGSAPMVWAQSRAEVAHSHQHPHDHAHAHAHPHEHPQGDHDQSPTSVVDFYVGPIVQSVTPNSGWILWESDSGTGSRVEFGDSPIELDRASTGTSIGSNGSRRIHSVPLGRLTPDTRYYYRAVTDDQASEVFWFRTPPIAAEERPFRFVALSDTQTDGAHDDQLVETVNDGILDFFSNTYGGDITDNLAFAMLAGDLVATGSNYPEWKVEFFDEAENLLHYIPLYPVSGNHEQDSHWYFDYFVLPENGTDGYYEHWYWHDYGNVRIIGLDSNGGYRIQPQLDWLDNVLADTAANDEIDFVFAQMHHPALSELWIPGETDYSMTIVEKLEAFSTSTGKPSIHFFGHTHGYSRGQSRDHQHLWVNVASGEGNPDYWGEYAQADYDEFAYSTPEYGFLVIDVTAGDEPAFTMRRYSRGNEFVERDNDMIDEITIRRVNPKPVTPDPMLPFDGATGVNPDAMTLVGSAFADSGGDAHWESHFQITTTPGDYSNPVTDEWIRFENWYAPEGASGPSNGWWSVNTVTDPDVTRVEIAQLDPNTTYAWRVRYRDEGLVWSEWSQEATFTTGDSLGTDNLLANPGAEQGVEHWDIEVEPLESLAADECGSETQPAEGSRFFAIGGVCAGESEYGEATQTIDVTDRLLEIDNGEWNALYAATLKNYAGSDRPDIWLSFWSTRDTLIGATEKIGTQSSLWTQVESLILIPRGTRFIKFHLSGTRNAGADNDSYADELELRLIPTDSCTADFNANGAVDTQDFLAFLNAWAAQDPAADIDSDGTVNSQDMLAFLNVWVVGC